MNALTNKLRDFLYTLYPEKILFEGNGLYSQVKVTKTGNRLNLYTGNHFLQTYYKTNYMPQGNFFDWYLILPWCTGNFNGSIESLLILGLGGGSQVKLFNQLYRVNHITGVEIDPLIIKLGKQYFDLNESNLTTLEQNAYLLFDTSSQKYSYIIIDNFKENMFENECQTKSFLEKAKNHLDPDGAILLNKLKDDVTNSDTLKTLNSIFSTVIEIKLKYNVFYISTNSNSAPNTPLELQKILLKASKSKNDLSFFKNLKIENILIHHK